jgi:glycosyltransferase involved in cell wall biosynthesis
VADGMDTDSVVRISVVLPCLNEEGAVGGVIDDAWRGIESTGLPGEVLVVDNGSTDRSAAIAREHGARVVQEPERGYGSAYLRGLAEARGDLIVMADADGTYPLVDLRPFVKLLEEGNDLVLGSRFRGRIQRGAMPWLHRWIGNPLLTAVLNVFFRVRVSDAHCGLRAVRREAVRRLELESTGMEFASEMILKAAKRGLRVGEVPIEYRPRIGESKLNTVRDGWRHLRFMLVHSSTFLFLVPGAFLLLFGLVIMIPLAAGPVTIFGFTWYIHAMIAGSTATLVGAQVLQLGLFARAYAVLYLGDSDPLLERHWGRLRLEHGLLGGALLSVAGAAVLAWIFLDWWSSGFGVLAREHEALFGLTLVGLGLQTMFASFFLSVLGLRGRHPAPAEQGAAPDSLPPAASTTSAPVRRREPAAKR